MTTAPPTPKRPTAQALPAAGRSGGALTLWFLAALGTLIVLALLSLSVGSKMIPPADVLAGVLAPTGTENDLIISGVRIPRTLLCIAAGAALAVAGTLMQALTRNPLADPGILGVNAGAALGVALGYIVFGVGGFLNSLWFAYAGAILATLVVYVLASTGGPASITPTRLTLSGVAVGAVLGGITSAMSLSNPKAFDSLRFWSAGSVAGREMDVVSIALPVIAIALVLALALGRGLNALSLGDDLAASLGSRTGATRALGAVAVTVLCGTATAAAGPIGFVGLMVPHSLRPLVGPDQRWLLAFSVVCGPILLLAADLVGRTIARPHELSVGVITAFVGAPILVWLALRRRGRIT